MLLLVDCGNLAMRCLFSSKETMQETEFKLFRHIYFKTLFASIKKFQPDEVILALEGRGGNWRRKIYPDYKKSRKKAKEESPVDFETFFKVLEDFEESMRGNLPFKVLKIPKVEADDIIGILSKKVKNKKKIIVSSDRDFKQLLIYKNVKLWDPIRKTWIESDDPKKDLLIKVICGDSSDEVPSLKKGVGVKTAEKIINKGIEELKRWLLHEDLLKKFKRNNQLINLSKIPKIIEKEVMKRYHNYTLPDPQIPEFLYKYNFRYFIDRIDQVEGILLGLYNDTCNK